MPKKSIAVIAAALLLVASVAPAVATDGSLAVSITQNEGGSATATVTHNDTTVENATVEVEAIDGNYSEEGTYTTDENGTVDLPAPGENVTIEVLAEYGNETASTTAELVATAENETTANGSFGARVSAFVHSLLNGTDEQRRIGRLIAGWVTANNPGNAPDHAGPPDDTGPPSVTDAGENESSGGNVTANGAPENPGKGDHGGNGNGPPTDRGSNGNGEARGHGK